MSLRISNRGLALIALSGLVGLIFTPTTNAFASEATPTAEVSIEAPLVDAPAAEVAPAPTTRLRTSPDHTTPLLATSGGLALLGLLGIAIAAIQRRATASE